MQLSLAYANYSDADEGPLSLGDIGTLVEDDGTDKPYRVEATNGKSWWYQKGALIPFQVILNSN